MVTVGLPTYNRPQELERAARSVLAQTHRDLELLISDNCSPDPAVRAVGERLAAEDERVRYFRQPRNLGHVLNFDWVRRNARGEHFMWLSDDDWLDPEYVDRCLDALSQPGVILAAGIARYGDVLERPTDLLSDRPGARVLRFFWRVNMNGALYGIARRDDWPEFPEVVGGDWLILASMARRGKVVTLRDVHINRSPLGLGSRPVELARSFGLDGFWARNHHLWIAQNVAREVGRELPVAGVLSGLAVGVRFPAIAAARSLLERAGAEWVEDRVTALVRSRD